MVWILLHNIDFCWGFCNLNSCVLSMCVRVSFGLKFLQPQHISSIPYTVWTKRYSDFIISALGSKHIAINMNSMIESLKCNWIAHGIYNTLLIYMRACGKPQSLYVLISIFHFTPLTENWMSVCVRSEIEYYFTHWADEKTSPISIEVILNKFFNLFKF